jgi:hypothetical protein
MRRHQRRAAAAFCVAAMLSLQVIVGAHSGPPFPVLSGQVAGAYDISIWSDPDSTDDGTAEGKFWVMLEGAGQRGPVPAGTSATVTIRPAGGDGPVRKALAEPVDGSAGRQYAALVLDHEGPFHVHVAVEGPWGPAEVEAQVDATYDLRPSPVVVVVYLLPFLAIGALWAKVLYRRRHGSEPGARPRHVRYSRPRSMPFQ